MEPLIFETDLQTKHLVAMRGIVFQPNEAIEEYYIQNNENEQFLIRKEDNKYIYEHDLIFCEIQYDHVSPLDTNQMEVKIVPVIPIIKSIVGN